MFFDPWHPLWANLEQTVNVLFIGCCVTTQTDTRGVIVFFVVVYRWFQYHDFVFFVPCSTNDFKIKQYENVILMFCHQVWVYICILICEALPPSHEKKTDDLVLWCIPAGSLCWFCAVVFCLFVCSALVYLGRFRRAPNLSSCVGPQDSTPGPSCVFFFWRASFPDRLNLPQRTPC